ALARRISDRHFGVGGDGLILVMPSDTADVRMWMFNADGSEAEMCGNGIRCVVKYAYDHGLSSANPMRVETADGIKTLQLQIDADGEVVGATVDMGRPVLTASDIPVAVPQTPPVAVPITLGSRKFQMTCVSMGNPHAVIYVDDIAAVPLEQLGPALENHRLFPRRVNAHFVQVNSPDQ
ncbi:MAG: diaminopimelate epimerase, partial [Pirellulaceae bacterium]|nr:diaminopimelate epimerase [Pirellulaceae bacterium]